MFKVGDEVICINDEDSYLKKYSSYTVMKVFNKGHIYGLKVRHIKVSGLDCVAYPIKRFMLLTEFRRQKIEELKYEIKQK